MKFIKKLFTSLLGPKNSSYNNKEPTKKTLNPQRVIQINSDAKARLKRIQKDKKQQETEKKARREQIVRDAQAKLNKKPKSALVGGSFSFPSPPQTKPLSDGDSDETSGNFSGMELEIDIGTNSNKKENEIKERIAQEIQDRIQRTTHHQAVHEAWIRLQKLFEKDKDNECVRSVMKSGRLDDHTYIIAHAPECPILREQRLERSRNQSRERSRGFDLGR